MTAVMIVLQWKHWLDNWTNDSNDDFREDINDNLLQRKFFFSSSSGPLRKKKFDSRRRVAALNFYFLLVPRAT
jgi:hypothetical protein